MSEDAEKDETDMREFWLIDEKNQSSPKNLGKMQTKLLFFSQRHKQ